MPPETFLEFLALPLVIIGVVHIMVTAATAVVVAVGLIVEWSPWTRIWRGSND